MDYSGEHVTFGENYSPLMKDCAHSAASVGRYLDAVYAARSASRCEEDYISLLDECIHLALKNGFYEAALYIFEVKCNPQY